jgi:hypothetical protein
MLTIKIARVLEKIIQWISPLENQKRHQDICLKRLANTGDWFIEPATFQKWRDSEGPEAKKILCCYAIPGAGKAFIK